MGAKQKAQLRRMVDFKFTRHPSLNLPEQRLTAIEKQLGERTRELLSIPVQRSTKRKMSRKDDPSAVWEHPHTADTYQPPIQTGMRFP